jgi:peptide deformylase
MILPIVKIPDPILSSPALPVTVFDDELKTLVKDMVETFESYQALGLSANQVGILKQVIVVRHIDEQGKQTIYSFINPVVTWRSDETEFGIEGCLSVDGKVAKVRRAVKIKVAGFTEEGKVCFIEAEKLFARIIQHEVDHANGLLITDRTKYIYRVDEQGKIIK